MLEIDGDFLLRRQIRNELLQGLRSAHENQIVLLQGTGVLDSDGLDALQLVEVERADFVVVGVRKPIVFQVLGVLEELLSSLLLSLQYDIVQLDFLVVLCGDLRNKGVFAVVHLDVELYLRLRGLLRVSVEICLDNFGLLNLDLLICLLLDPIDCQVDVFKQLIRHVHDGFEPFHIDLLLRVDELTDSQDAELEFLLHLRQLLLDLGNP